MLTERCVISLLADEAKPSNAPNQDAGLLFYEVQPASTVRSSFKKCSVRVNCLAASSTHAFAAQAGKAVIHVYNLDKGSQEAIVPFPEPISSLALIGPQDSPGILAIGFKNGSIRLWELCTGRQVSTPASHLGSVKCLAVDATYNFLLSGSDDSNIHVWSIPALLSFSSADRVGSRNGVFHAPLRTFSDHRSAILALSIGNSGINTCMAVSSSEESICIIWDYRMGDTIRIFLLSLPALTLTIDPAERAIYAGLRDGSIQMINLIGEDNHTGPLRPSMNSFQQPTQPPEKDRWRNSTASGQAALSLGLSFDGTLLLSGHQDGKVHTWDVAKGRYDACPLAQSAPITNILVLKPQGFPTECPKATKMTTVVKPRLNTALFEDKDTMTESSTTHLYSFASHFDSDIVIPRFCDDKGEDFLMAEFEAALVQNTWPGDSLETTSAASLGGIEPYFDEQSSARAVGSEDLRKVQEQLDASRKMCKYALGHVDKLSNELRWLRERDKAKERAKRMKRIKKAKAAEAMRKKAMGETVDEDAMITEEDDVDEAEEASSTTDMPSGDE